MLNIIIPLAGKGSRFSELGYTLPKPLIPILGKPMVYHAIECCEDIDNSRFIFIVQQEHIDLHNIDKILKEKIPSCEIVVLDGITEGAACSILHTKHLIDNDDSLLIMNCDNIINWDKSVLDELHINDGTIITFTDTSGSKKWSYAKVSDDLYVSEVAEKQPISTTATAGIYIWAKGSNFVDAAKQMIDKNIRFNNEFYLAPVYNQNIDLGHKINISEAHHVDTVGTPEELISFLRKNND